MATQVSGRDGAAWRTSGCTSGAQHSAARQPHLLAVALVLGQTLLQALHVAGGQLLGSVGLRDRPADVQRRAGRRSAGGGSGSGGGGGGKR